eukprot:TRINITY_DN1463_c0_g1_i14.p2 TRINITY_DN1463_c0_g1~~TRINITY_DN1463_c0_g1_i14.p2  ORF type:complete len:142 (-),score=9.42 TRINITY_DN1463_c0_g1_i14:1833-2258(-)
MYPWIPKQRKPCPCTLTASARLWRMIKFQTKLRYLRRVLCNLPTNFLCSPGRMWNVSDQTLHRQHRRVAISHHIERRMHTRVLFWRLAVLRFDFRDVCSGHILGTTGLAKGCTSCGGLGQLRTTIDAVVTAVCQSCIIAQL